MKISIVVAVFDEENHSSAPLEKIDATPANVGFIGKRLLLTMKAPIEHGRLRKVSARLV